MNKILILLLFFLISLNGIAQITEKSDHIEKYFHYYQTKTSCGAFPLFAQFLEKDPERKYMGYDIANENWDYLMKRFADILHQYLSIEQIKNLRVNRGSSRASFEVVMEFNYYGEIEYCNFIMNIKDREILTDSILYQIYQDLLQTKIDVSVFTWYDRNPSPELKKKIFSKAVLPFFFWKEKLLEYLSYKDIQE